MLQWREFRVQCFVRMELRLLEWKEHRLFERRELRVKCFVRMELGLLEWREFSVKCFVGAWVA